MVSSSHEVSWLKNLHLLLAEVWALLAAVFPAVTFTLSSAGFHGNHMLVVVDKQGNLRKELFFGFLFPGVNVGNVMCGLLAIKHPTRTTLQPKSLHTTSCKPMLEVTGGQGPYVQQPLILDNENKAWKNTLKKAHVLMGKLYFFNCVQQGRRHEPETELLSGNTFSVLWPAKAKEAMPPW